MITKSPEIVSAPPRSRNSNSCVQTAHAFGVPRNYGRERGLKRLREPKRLCSIGKDFQNRPQWLTPHAARAWSRMREAALLKGVELQVVSAFRSIEYQLSILQRKLARGQSMHDILRVSAAPGYSEHHSGRAVDLTTPGFTALEEEFENSPAFAWLSTYAADYGFRLSFPRGNAHGIAFEPWHWYYVGVDKRVQRRQQRKPTQSQR